MFALRLLPWMCLCLTLALKPICAQEAPPAPKLEFIQPTAGTTLQGAVQVRVRALPDDLVPEAVYLSFYGPPWLRLTRIGDTNEWQADLDTRLTGNGPNTLVARAYYAATVKPARAARRASSGAARPTPRRRASRTMARAPGVLLVG